MNNFKKLALGFILIFFQITAHAADNHFVFLVHGIASKPESFGMLAEIIGEQHDSLADGSNLYVEKFQYKTQDDKIDVNKISIELADFIEEKIKSRGGIGSHDKISLIAHSQGGLIATRYLLRSAMGDARYHKKYLQNYFSFITLGSPLWGSKVAILGTKLKALARLIGLDILSDFGSTQLAQMQVTSPTIDELRYLLIEPFAQTLMQQLQSQIKFVHFAGMPEPLKFLRPFVTGKNQFEDDTAVPLPSTHLDFSYYVEKSDYTNKSVINVEDFYSTKFSTEENFYPVSAFHSPILKNGQRLHGIGYFPKNCLQKNYKYCPHPVLAPLIETLLGLRPSRRARTDYSSFAFDLRLRFEGVVNEKILQKLKLKIKKGDDFTKIGKPSEIFKRVRRFDSKGNYYLYHTGFINNPDREAGEVSLLITLPGYVPKSVSIPVTKGRTSFLDLTLLRN